MFLVCAGIDKIVPNYRTFPYKPLVLYAIKQYRQSVSQFFSLLHIIGISTSITNHESKYMVFWSRLLLSYIMLCRLCLFLTCSGSVWMWLHHKYIEKHSINTSWRSKWLSRLLKSLVNLHCQIIHSHVTGLAFRTFLILLFLPFKLLSISGPLTG